MKIMLVGDLHLRSSKPISRKDDFEQTVLNKFEQIHAIARGMDCELILQAGDFFDIPNPSYRLLDAVIQIRKNSNIKMFSIYGQHDLFFHSSETRGTALGILNSLGLVHHIQQSGSNYITHNELFRLYGVSWFDNDDVKADENIFNILVMHRMITDSGPLWPGQTDYMDAKTLLRREYNFDLILTGDNHKSFCVKYGSHHLFNPGSILRTSISQKDHRPHVIIFDTVKRTYQKANLAVADFEDVFDVEKATRKQEMVQGLSEFVASLSDHEYVADQIDFERAIRDHMHELPSSVQQIVKEAIGESE